MNKVPQWLSDVWVPELLLPPKIIRIFGPRTAILPRNMPSWTHIGLAGSFGALLVGRSAVVARRLCPQDTSLLYH